MPTVEAYTNDLRMFLRHLEELKIKKPTTIKAEHVTGHLLACKRAGKSNASVCRYYMSIKGFLDHLRRAKVIDNDIMYDVQKPQNNAKMPKVLSLEEVKAIINQPNVNSDPGLRDRAIMELLYSSGLRVSELCDLRIEDIQDMQVQVKCGKRDKTRSVPMTQEASTWIQLYLQGYRASFDLEGDARLFLTVQGKPVRRQLLADIVTQHSKNAKVKNVTPHTFRHTCATHLMDKGADTRMIQTVLGHASISSTERYTHFSSASLLEKFNLFHPRGNT